MMEGVRECVLSLEREQTKQQEQQKKKGGTAKFLALLIGYVCFLLLGATLFMYLLYDIEHKQVLQDRPTWAAIKGGVNTTGNASSQQQQQQHRWILQLCPHLQGSLLLQPLLLQGSLSAAAEEMEESCPALKEEVTVEEFVYFLHFVDALYFSMTIITTIGYGHICPRLPWAKVGCMAYAVIGVPLTGILLARTSDFFGEKTFILFQSMVSGQKQRSQRFIVLATLLYISLGFAVFIFLPALVFHYLEEDWTYLDSVYYAFITLTTIGFGDLVTGSSMEYGAGRSSYQVSVIVWIIISLGYWVMVANFITRALRSKRLHASLVQRAKLLKAMMASQGNVDPVFLPQKSKNTMNFMLQLSSMLPVTNESSSDNLQVQEALSSAAAGGPGQRDQLLGGQRLGVPGIASLFNFPRNVSATNLNRKICG